MEYASKNMMINIHSIVKQTVKSLEKNESFNKKINQKDLQAHLTIQADSIVNNILIN